MWIHKPVAILALCIPALSFAGVDCVGTIGKVLMYSDGTVAVYGSWRGDYTYVCSTNGNFGNVPAGFAWAGSRCCQKPGPTI